MQLFDDIYKRAAKRKGGELELQTLLSQAQPKSPAELNKIPDDRWLSSMTKSVFQAGFVWRVVENKWPAFEQVFHQFNLLHVAYLSDEDIDIMMTNTDIIRHYKKLLSTRHNASFLLEVIEQHGSAANYFSHFSSSQYVDLLIDLKKRATRLGGTSAQYFLRRIGMDSFILSGDVVKALKIAKVVTQQPSSQRDLRAVQVAFNHWSEQTGLCLTHISRILAMSVD